ncbi:hypothetical protein ACQW08_04785 [Gluconobacter japonicus]|uniref:hypothetical protein n=1 Tax=Gluconobacter japonicus TaxID=376620 RepID=UPI003D2DB189
MKKMIFLAASAAFFVSGVRAADVVPNHIRHPLHAAAVKMLVPKSVVRMGATAATSASSTTSAPTLAPGGLSNANIIAGLSWSALLGDTATYADNSVQQADIGSTVAGLDGSGSVTAPVTGDASGASARSAYIGSVTRTVSDKWSDLPTVRDMGALMTGATTDEAPIQDSYDAAVAGVGVINVPKGVWPSVDGVPFAPARTDLTKTVLWNLLGPVTANGRPFSVVGSGDVTVSYSANSRNYARRWDHGVSDAPVVRVALDNWASDWNTTYSGASTPLALGVSAYSHPGSNGNTVGAHVDLYSYGTTAGVGMDQAYAAGITKAGTNSVWGSAYQITDITGHDADSTIAWLNEWDLMSNGEDVTSSQYDPSKSSRVFAFLSAKM